MYQKDGGLGDAHAVARFYLPAQLIIVKPATVPALPVATREG